MKQLDTSFATATVGQPVKSGTLNFLQLAYQEAITALANQLIGNGYTANTIYVLAGCINTGAGTTLTISSGYLFVNGLVYAFAGANFTPVQVGVSNFATAQYTTNADPTQFTDGSSHNVHNIITIVLSDAASGSGNVTGDANSDYANWQRVGTPAAMSKVTATFPTYTYTATFTRNLFEYFTTGLTGTNAYVITFDFTNAIPGVVTRLSFPAASGATLTFTAPAGCLLVNDSGAYTATATNVVYLIYVGVNAAGNHEVSYTVNHY